MAFSKELHEIYCMQFFVMKQICLKKKIFIYLGI